MQNPDTPPVPRRRRGRLVPALIGVALGAALGLVVLHRPLVPPTPAPVVAKAKVERVVYATAGRDVAHKVMMVRPDGTGLRELKVDIGNGSELVAVNSDGTLAVIGEPGDTEGYMRLFLVRTDGTGKTDLSGGNACGDYHAAFRPDGQIVFVRSSGERMGLYATTGKGEAPRLLVREDGFVSSLACSPDGKRIAFTREDDLYMVGIERKDVRRLAPRKAIRTFPSFTPDGTRLLFGYCPEARDVAEGLNLASINLDGSGFRELTDYLKDGGCSGHSFPAMDPSGTHIAYVRTHIDGVYEVEGQVAGPYHAPDLYIMDADGANPRKLAENATNPSWILREE